MHVTGIVPLALKNSKKGLSTSETLGSMDSINKDNQIDDATSKTISAKCAAAAERFAKVGNNASDYIPFTPKSNSFIYGMQPRAVQGMLDYDFMCKRTGPSVACMIYPFGGHHVQKFYWGTTEVLIPVYTSIKEACERFPGVDICVNFASSRRYVN